MLPIDLLTRTAAEVSVAVTPELAEKLEIYARLLVEWNEKINLTAITDPAGIAVKHFADSLSAAPLLPQGAFSLIDVGTGAGFPGVPLALLREDCALTLLDSLQKRLTFLDALCRELGLKAILVHARAEEGGQDPALRERFDMVTARAVAALPVLCEYCLPFARVGGRFIALKGPGAEEERAGAGKAVSVLGGEWGKTTRLVFPADPPAGVEPMERHLIEVRKVRLTPPKYPRPSAKMAKQPL